MRVSQSLSLSFPLSLSSPSLFHSHLFPAPVSIRLSTPITLCPNENIHSHWCVCVCGWNKRMKKPLAELLHCLLIFLVFLHPPPIALSSHCLDVYLSIWLLALWSRHCQEPLSHGPCDVGLLRVCYTVLSVLRGKTILTPPLCFCDGSLGSKHAESTVECINGWASSSERLMCVLCVRPTSR